MIWVLNGRDAFHASASFLIKSQNTLCYQFGFIKNAISGVINLTD